MKRLSVLRSHNGCQNRSVSSLIWLSLLKKWYHDELSHGRKSTEYKHKRKGSVSMETSAASLLISMIGRVRVWQQKSLQEMDLGGVRKLDHTLLLEP